MISLEQVQLLELKVAKAIEIIEQLSKDNSALVSEREGLQSKLNSNQKRLDELELLVMRFKEDQGRIEDGIIAALDRLSQFEEAFESGLKDDKLTGKKNIKKEKPAEKVQVEKEDTSDSNEFFEISEEDSERNSDDELDIF